MAKEQKTEEVVEEVVKNKPGRKPKADKVQKEVNIVDEIIEDSEEDFEDKVEPEIVVPKKTSRELRKELRIKKNEIEVEILNIHSGGVSCRDRNGRILFDFDSYGEREFVVLADLYEVATRYKGFFEKHQITIIDVDSLEYTIEDIIEYLGLNELYDEIENYDTDYISQILTLKYGDFEKFITSANIELVRAVASRAVSLFKVNKFDSRLKEKLIANRLGREDLFDI